MKRIVLALALACSTAFAVDTKPSDASIKELLTVSESQSVVEGIWGQVDGMMKGMLAQVGQGKALNAKQQAAVDSFQAKYIALMREEVSWTKLEPMYVRIYQDALSQEEVDGMIAFYKTTAGKAMIKKMPVLIQRIMTELPALMGPVMAKIEPMAQQLEADMKAAETPAAAPAARAIEPAAGPAVAPVVPPANATTAPVSAPKK
jgi:hypothetical protein